MESHKQSTIMHAMGFVEDYLHDNTEPLEVNEETMTDEQMNKNTIINEQREQARAMWAVLETGYRQLLVENGRLLNKIAMAELALRS